MEMGDRVPLLSPPPPPRPGLYSNLMDVRGNNMKDLTGRKRRKWRSVNRGTGDVPDDKTDDNCVLTVAAWISMGQRDSPRQGSLLKKSPSLLAGYIRRCANKKILFSFLFSFLNWILQRLRIFAIIGESIYGVQFFFFFLFLWTEF